MTTKVTKINADGSIKTKTTDTRTLEQKLNGKLTFAEKLSMMYPTKTTESEITKGWSEFDNHKRLK